MTRWIRENSRNRGIDAIGNKIAAPAVWHCLATSEPGAIWPEPGLKSNRYAALVQRLLSKFIDLRSGSQSDIETQVGKSPKRSSNNFRSSAAGAGRRDAKIFVEGGVSRRGRSAARNQLHFRTDPATYNVLDADFRPVELSSHFELNSFSLAPRWSAPGATDASQWSIASTVNRQSLPTRNAGN